MAGFGNIARPTEGNNAPHALAGPSSTHRAPFRHIRPTGDRRSEFITTRCYSPTGQLLWDGDHGTTVFALAVDAYGAVYQSGKRGTGSTAGDSLFHREADGQVPLITAMFSKGRPKWSVLQGASGPLESYGIAATSNGAVYVSIKNYNDATQNRVAKKSAVSGADLLTMPVGGFLDITSTPFINSASQLWKRVRVDGSNNVYAAGKTAGSFPTNTIFKWSSDAEYWVWHDNIADFDYLAGTGLGVSTDGRVFIPSDPTPTGSSPPYKPYLYITDASTSNLSPPAYASYLARKLKPLDGEPGWPPLGIGGYTGAGVSPSGLAIMYDNINDAISTVAVGGTPDTPAVAQIQSVPGLGGSLGLADVAISINDSGTYCYSVDRGTTSPVRSHEIRDSGNNLIGSYDHGGAINDCIVLPSGRVIVAGERVPR